MPNIAKFMSKHSQKTFDSCDGNLVTVYAVRLRLCPLKSIQIQSTFRPTIYSLLISIKIDHPWNIEPHMMKNCSILFRRVGTDCLQILFLSCHIDIPSNHCTFFFFNTHGALEAFRILPCHFRIESEFGIIG